MTKVNLNDETVVDPLAYPTDKYVEGWGDTNTGGLTFKVWLRHVDRQVSKKCGLGCMDLPDIDYWNLWNDGVEPRDAAFEVLEEAGFPLDEEWD